MIMTPADFMKAFPAFRTSPDRMVRDLLEASASRIVPVGARLYTEGDACSAIAFVLSGEIRVYKIGQGGREITLYEIGPGETCILNASCILAGRSYPAHAVTQTDAQILLIPSAVFRRLIEENESMRRFVFTLLSERLTGVMELVEEVAFGRMDARLRDYLVEKAENGRLETTHQRIANDLGTSREVVSRLLKELERRKEVRLARSEILLLQREDLWQGGSFPQ